MLCCVVLCCVVLCCVVLCCVVLCCVVLCCVVLCCVVLCCVVLCCVVLCCVVLCCVVLCCVVLCCVLPLTVVLPFQKDATIRELTDRLYFGSEKFQEYLHSPRNRNSMLCEVQRRYARRTVSQPLQAARTSDIFRDDRMAMRNRFVIAPEVGCCSESGCCRTISSGTKLHNVTKNHEYFQIRDVAL